MDLQKLVGLLDSTLHPEPEVRQNSEHQLQQSEGQPDFLRLLLQVFTSAELPISVKQAASIYFKNRVRRSWFGSQRSLELYAPLSEEDRTAAKENILSAIYSSSMAIKRQLTESLSVILKHDFPEHWPQYLVQTKDLLHAPDAEKVYTGLLALVEVIKIYRYTPSKRTIIDEIAKELMPQVQKIAEQAIISDDGLAMRMVWLSFKAYFNCMYTGLPVTFRQPDCLVAWGTNFLQMIQKPVSFDRETADENMAKEPVWKAKKWATRCTNRLYSRYGNPALLSSSNSKHYLEFAKMFTANFLPQILQVHFKQIEGYTTGDVWMSQRVRGLVFQFLSDCVKEKVAWKLLKPHFENIVSHFVFPHMCFNQEDQELWEENPAEYVQKRVDPLDDFGSAPLSANNLLIDLAFDRKKTTLTPILNFINGVLTTYSQSAEEARDPRSKDGALNMMGALCDVLCSRKSPIRDTIPSFLLTHVVPEFKSQHGFLRARALDTYCRYSAVQFPDKQVLRGIFESVFSLLNDTELPVRVQAALALRPMIANEDVHDALGNHLPQVMQVFLNLTNEIDSDTVTHVIEEFVDAYSDRMAPFAVELAQQLCATFTRIMGDVMSSSAGGGPGMEEVSDKTMAAMGVLKTLGTLIINLEGTPEIVYQLEEVVFPVIRFVLDERQVELYDEVFEILDCFMFCVKAVSPNAWKLFESVYSCFKSNGVDFIEEMLPSLDNYVTYGIDVIVSNNEIQSRLYDVIETIMKTDRVGENDRICACKLMQTTMLQGNGKVDAMVPGFISLSAAYLLVSDAIKTPQFLIYTLEVVLTAMYYNAKVTLDVLEHHGWTEGIFTQLMQNVDKFVRVYDKKLVIFGLLSVLNLPSAQLPAVVQNGLPQLFNGVLQAFGTLEAAIETRESVIRMYEGDSEDEDDNLSNEFLWDADEFGEGGEDDGEGDDGLDPEYAQKLAAMASKALGGDDEEEGNINGYTFDDDEDSDEYGDGPLLEEEYGFESPLDNIDPYVYLQDKLSEMQSSSNPSYGVVVQSLSADNTSRLESLMETANQHRSSQ